MKDNVEIAKDYTDWMVKTGGYARDMTLRDHFAGMAMQGLMSYEFSSYQQTAAVAYHLANAMLEERNK